MYIKMLTCPQCHKSGRLGDTFPSFGLTYNPLRLDVQCDCGEKIQVDDQIRAIDLQVLSSWVPYSIHALSNRVELGREEVHAGEPLTIEFDPPFDLIGDIGSSISGGVFTPIPNINGDGFILPTSTMPSFKRHFPDGGKFEISWSAWGLVGTKELPLWYTLFYNGLRLMVQHSYKLALMEFATAFEVSLEQTLRHGIASRYDAGMADFLLRKFKAVDTRYRELLIFATGHSHQESTATYNAWREHVQEPRNAVTHGSVSEIDKKQILNARDAVYQAIRWSQDLTPGSPSLGDLLCQNPFTGSLPWSA